MSINVQLEKCSRGSECTPCWWQSVLFPGRTRMRHVRRAHIEHSHFLHIVFLIQSNNGVNFAAFGFIRENVTNPSPTTLCGLSKALILTLLFKLRRPAQMNVNFDPLLSNQL
eukprot:m.58145 g.58145  ORF g.58145 m.58145 type:complete len:112 (+) comp9394_c0_seq1:1659-1994(+)